MENKNMNPGHGVGIHEFQIRIFRIEGLAELLSWKCLNPENPDNFSRTKLVALKTSSFFALIAVLVILGIVNACSGSHTNKDSEWQTLFNGHDINDWVVKINHHNTGENFGNTFRVEDGIIKVRYDQYGDFNDQFSHLFYKKPFSSFHLKFEYRFTGEQQRGAPDYTLMNSGVMFHSQDPATILKEQNWPISIEMQLLAGLGDGQPRPTGNMCSPGTEIVYQGKQYDGHCLNSSSKTYPKDVWVKGELI